MELKSDWPKGYSRLGAAYDGLVKYEDSIKAYEEGLKLDPNNEALKSGLSDVKEKLRKHSGEEPTGMSKILRVCFREDVSS